jgi:hypothetical protein
MVAAEKKWKTAQLSRDATILRDHKDVDLDSVQKIKITASNFLETLKMMI